MIGVSQKRTPKRACIICGTSLKRVDAKAHNIPIQLAFKRSKSRLNGRRIKVSIEGVTRKMIATTKYTTTL